MLCTSVRIPRGIGQRATFKTATDRRSSLCRSTSPQDRRVESHLFRTLKVYASTDSLEEKRSGDDRDRVDLRGVQNASTASASIEEYEQLKGQILKNSVFSGGFFLVYLSATISLKA